MTAVFARRLRDGRAGFPDLLASIEAHLEDHDVPPGAAAQLMISFDEIISNILNHGDAAGCPTVEVRLRLDDGSASAEIVDDGTPFDPLTLPAPDTMLSVEERQIGGLGIHLVRELMDEVVYAHEAGRNRLRFSKNYAVS